MIKERDETALLIKIPTELHGILKEAARRRNISMKVYVLESLLYRLKVDKEINSTKSKIESWY